MKHQIVLKKINLLTKKIIASSLWQKMFVHQIDEEKMQEYQNQHRLMALTRRIF